MQIVPLTSQLGWRGIQTNPLDTTVDKSTAGRVAQQPPPPRSALWQMGFYAACTKALWLFGLAQHQQQTVAVCDNQAAVGLTEREKVHQHRRQIILLHTFRQTDTDMHTARLHGNGRLHMLTVIKYNIQQQAEATQEQHLSTWTLTGEMRRQTGT